MSDSLENLLRRADASAGGAITPREIAARAWARRERRRRARRAAGFAVVMVAVSLAGSAMRMRWLREQHIAGANDARQVIPTDTAAREELAVLDRDARWHAALAQAMSDHERRWNAMAAARRSAARPDAMALVAGDREDAAAVLVSQGDWLWSRDDFGAARREYALASTLFAETLAARQARQKVD